MAVALGPTGGGLAGAHACVSTGTGPAGQPEPRGTQQWPEMGWGSGQRRLAEAITGSKAATEQAVASCRGEEHGIEHGGCTDAQGSGRAAAAASNDNKGYERTASSMGRTTTLVAKGAVEAKGAGEGARKRQGWHAGRARGARALGAGRAGRG